MSRILQPAQIIGFANDSRRASRDENLGIRNDVVGNRIGNLHQFHVTHGILRLLHLHRPFRSIRTPHNDVDPLRFSPERQLSDRRRRLLETEFLNQCLRVAANALCLGVRCQKEQRN